MISFIVNRYNRWKNTPSFHDEAKFQDSKFKRKIECEVGDLYISENHYRDLVENEEQVAITVTFKTTNVSLKEVMAF